MVQFGPECVVFELCLVEGIEDNDLRGQYGPGELHDEICGVWICERGGRARHILTQIDPCSRGSFY